MQNRNTIAAVLFILLISSAIYFYTRPKKAISEGISDLVPGSGKITILYNDYVYDTKLRAEPGLSILVESPQLVVLFDTGGDTQILQDNIEVLGVNISKVDCIVLSHEHWDHLGGLEYVLSKNPGIPVYVPGEYSQYLEDNIESFGGKCVPLGNATKLCDSIGVTNTIYGTYDEQGLVVMTGDGLFLLAGCGHAGIENIASDVVKSSGENISLILGGFHTSSLVHACDVLDEIGVDRVAPIHGGLSAATLEYLETRYGDNYIQSGVGFILDYHN